MAKELTARDIRATPIDGYPTYTSETQEATEEDLRPRFETALADDTAEPDSFSGPALQRNQHLQFLLRNLQQGFPGRYMSQDASQPWLIFWTLQGFSVLGVGIDAQTKKRYAGLYIIE